MLQFQAAVLSHEGFKAAATAYASELASALKFDRVAVGVFENDYTTVAAISHSAEFESKAVLVRAIGEAMDEAIEQGQTIVYPASAGERPQIALAHATLLRHQRGAACTIPLVSNGRAFGAVTMLRGTEAPPSREEIAKCEHLSCLVGPILDLKYRDQRSWFKRATQAVRMAWQYLRAPQNLRARVAACAAALIAAALLFVPVEYRVSAPSRLEGSIQRVLVAPVDGFLRQTHVRPGDAVTEGQLLFELSEQDLQLEQRKWQSELEQHKNTYLAALARADRTQFVINQAKASEARAQLDLVEQQLARSRVQAPFDGVIIKGDLTQSLGAPVQRGEVLLTIAPAQQFRLIVEVDERDIAEVQPGQTGRLALAALPNSTLAFRVARVTPVSTTREGRNFFEVEGKFDAAAAAALRPGLQGVAKIKVEDQPLAWIWTHRFVDWLKIALWSWGA